MRFSHRIVLRLLIAYILALIFFSLVPRFEHIQDFDRAFIAWYKHPTPENEAAFRIQQHKKRILDWEINAVGAFILVAVGYGIFCGVRLTTSFIKSNRHTSI
jgi:hypothetical protein